MSDDIFEKNFNFKEFFIKKIRVLLKRNLSNFFTRFEKVKEHREQTSKRITLEIFTGNSFDHGL